MCQTHMSSVVLFQLEDLLENVPIGFLFVLEMKTALLYCLCISHHPVFELLLCRSIALEITTSQQIISKDTMNGCAAKT